MTFPHLPPQEPIALDQYTPGPPPKRRRVALLVGIGAAVLVAAAVGAAGAVELTGHRGAVKAAATTPSPAAASSAPPSIPPPPPMDERLACSLLLPVLQAGTDSILALADHPDGTTVDKAKLGKAIDDLTTLREVSPDTLKADIWLELKTLQELQEVITTGVNINLALSDYRSAGLRLVARCSP